MSMCRVTMEFCVAVQPRQKRTNAWSEIVVARHPSIWSKGFRIKEVKEKKQQSVTPKKEKLLPARLPSTRGLAVVLKTDSLRNEITPRKRTFEGEFFLFCQYGLCRCQGD